MFAARLQTLLLLFRDSHLHVAPTPSPSAAWIPSAADLWFRMQGSQLMVRDVKGDSAAARLGVRPGWELVAIDGTGPLAAIDARFAELGVEADDSQRLYAVNSLAAGRLGQPRHFTFRVDGQLRRLELPPGYESTRPRQRLLHASTLRGTAAHPVVVIRVANSLGENELIAAFDRAMAALPPEAHLVIDLRDTPSGGNSTVARGIMGHFVRQPTPFQRHELTAERVQFGVPRSWVEYVEPRAPHHAGRLTVLAGLWTGSMGEGLVIGLHAVAGATVIGTTMGRLLGATVTSKLAVSCLALTYGNERLWHVNGTPREAFLPEHLLPGADTAVDGSDPALRHALDLLAQPE